MFVGWFKLQGLFSLPLSLDNLLFFTCASLVVCGWHEGFLSWTTGCMRRTFFTLVLFNFRQRHSGNRGNRMAYIRVCIPGFLEGRLQKSIDRAGRGVRIGLCAFSALRVGLVFRQSCFCTFSAGL
ncbi:hypothetical protein CONLIGDRAFT_290619 [Coniochaeta ligniaria NRRL 30616]|uniref:Uncharacterized protein n=1 Tax=Coniochaeta ligniaria NRRL 30616 TaxID=1408157 RepID=A0A1J7JNA9_9PEZI|nr:hypothetical protein CONLIGDRAFT_290619 [Coniochaeta ligniaria NRRL 30616]